YSGYGISGTITDETTGEPVKATIFVNDYFPCYNDLNNGDYHKYLLPGTYNILVKANGYDEKLVEGVVVTAENSTISDITLTPSENKNFAYKVVSCQIPDNNTADLGFTPNIIGEPDGNAYSIGKSGWIVFDMLNAVEDGPGPDISIVESDTPESFTLYIGETLDGPWHEVGTGTGTTAFDIASSGLPSSRFFKIKDNSSGSSNVLGAGFDFDGAIALEHSDGPYIVSMGYSIDDSTGNNDNRIDPGETVTINIDLKNGGNEVASNLLMNLSYESVFVTIDNTEFSLEQLNVDEEYSVSFQLTAEENTPPATIFNLALHIAVENSTNSFDYEYQFMIAGFLIEEYFTSFPPEGWAIEGGSNWCSGSSNNAGGTAPEAMFNWNPSTVGDQYLISPAINTNGKTKLFLEFKQMINYYGAGYELFLVSSSDKENWNVITEFENSASVPATTETIEITNSDVGSETFYVAWLFSGDSYQINYWYVDDVIMTGENGSGTEEGNIVENFELIGNYPNPFNPETNIRFINNISGKMEFTVFNSNGQLVYNDIKDLRSIGMNTIKFDGSSLNSGVYFYSIKMNSVEHYGKMMLLK
ncbi:MAG: choice-of-anchor J domain-containing protein, partial [Candidatus Delongbacteria bacterium]|nr:choice-of-anchor J domain-containing protein [Candidatus Delongbacteria bacterium]